ncbi:MAG: hypothetical protein ACI9CU_001087, partial [Polaribacter sp.]
YDSTSKLILTRAIQKQEVIDISTLPAGLYFASIQDENYFYHQRLVVAK